MCSDHNGQKLHIDDIVEFQSNSKAIMGAIMTAKSETTKVNINHLRMFLWLDDLT